MTKVLTIDLDFISNPYARWINHAFSLNTSKRWSEFMEETPFDRSHFHIDTSNLMYCFNTFLKALKSNPKVSDQQYDRLKNEILLLEKKYKFLKSKNSPAKAVGHKPSKNFKKFQHRASMLSLSNAFSEEDLKNFEKRILNFLSENNEFKIIGNYAKAARGLMVDFIVKNKITSVQGIKQFNVNNYRFDEDNSTSSELKFIRKNLLDLIISA